MIVLIFISCNKINNKNQKNTNKELTLNEAIKVKDYLEIEKLLKENKIEVNEKISPMTLAIAEKDLKTIDLLLKYNFDLNKTKSISNGVVALSSNNEIFLKELIDRGLKLSIESLGNETALISYLSFSEKKVKLNYKVLEIALNHSEDINYVNLKGVNALLLSIDRKDIELINFLLNKGLNVNLKDSDNQNGLSLAVEKEYYKKEIVELLIKKGIDINNKDNEGCTPIFYAINSGNIEAVETLIGKGIDINISNNNGETPLIIASDNNNVEMVKFLLKNGANKDLKDNEGSKAIDYTDNEEIKKLLK